MQLLFLYNIPNGLKKLKPNVENINKDNLTQRHYNTSNQLT